VCAHAVSVAVKKVNGVESVNVSLNEGKASIHFKPESTAKYEGVRTGIEKNGFAVKDAYVRARGRLQQTNDGLQFVVSGSGETFTVTPEDAKNVELAQAMQKKTGEEVILEGTVPTPEKNKTQTTFKVKAIK
jgi:copper chaperone CopZ